MGAFLGRLLLKETNDIKVHIHSTVFHGVQVIARGLQYIPRNMHSVFALLCFVVVIHWLIFPYPSGLLHWHCGNLTIAPVPAKQPRWIWINTSCEFIMNDCITTTKQSTTKPCAYFLRYTVTIAKPQLKLRHGQTNPTFMIMNSYIQWSLLVKRIPVCKSTEKSLI